MALTKLETRATSIAEENMDVAFQMEVARQETEIYYTHLVETRDFIRKSILEKTGRDKLDGWIVCGSGLANLPKFEEVKALERIPVETIPNWYYPQAPGHGKDIVIADISGQLVGIATGRDHIYDIDNSPRQLKMITAPLIVAKGLGVNWLITTNAAGILDNGRVRVGDVIVDIDYVNQHGVNPLMGPNDVRLGVRFPGKADVADPYIFSRLEQFIPPENLHLGIYTLSSNAPLYEGIGDIEKGMYRELTRQNPHLVEAFGMSFAMEAMVMQHFNNPPKDENGFDRPVRWIGLSAATNIIPQVSVPTKEMLRAAALPNPNPTNEEEVIEAGKIAEKLLIPAVVNLCDSITKEPLPPAY